MFYPSSCIHPHFSTKWWARYHLLRRGGLDDLIQSHLIRLCEPRLVGIAFKKIELLICKRNLLRLWTHHQYKLTLNMCIAYKYLYNIYIYINMYLVHCYINIMKHTSPYACVSRTKIVQFSVLSQLLHHMSVGLPNRLWSFLCKIIDLSFHEFLQSAGRNADTTWRETGLRQDKLFQNGSNFTNQKRWVLRWFTQKAGDVHSFSKLNLAFRSTKCGEMWGYSLQYVGVGCTSRYIWTWREPLGHDFTELNFSHSMNPMVQAATVSATWPSRRTARPQKAIKRHFCATAVDVRHY